MEQWFDLASLESMYREIEGWFFDDVLVPSTLRQALVIIAAFVLARVLAPAIRRGIDRLAERQALVEKRQFQRFHCHDLRHKFAVEYLKSGGDIYALARIRGHSSVKTTEIYLAYTSEGVSQKVSQQRRFSGAGEG